MPLVFPGQNLIGEIVLLHSVGTIFFQENYSATLLFITVNTTINWVLEQAITPLAGNQILSITVVKPTSPITTHQNQ